MVKLQEYKYKELCEAMGEKQKTGKSKQLQLQNWARQFLWENPTKQIFKIIEFYEVPREKIDNRGGAREGSGAPLKMQKEFDYIFNCFLMRQWRRNEYNNQSNWNQAYFSNHEISKYFGLYRENFYSYKNGEGADAEAFKKVSAKLNQKRRSWIIEKIKKAQGVIYSEGIVCTKIIENSRNKESIVEYKDELLNDWKKYQQEYLEKMEYRGIHQILDSDNWLDMIEYISAKWPEYDRVEKQHKVSYGRESHELFLREFDMDEYEAMRISFNSRVVEELKVFFSKKEETKKLEVINQIIDQYVRLPENSICISKVA